MAEGHMPATPGARPGRVVVPVRTAGVTVVQLHGDIDLASADLLEDCVVAGVAGGADVLIDLADVTLIDGASMSALVRAGRFADRRGRMIRLVAPSRFVGRILAAAGLDETFLLSGDRDNAIAELSRRPIPPRWAG